MTTVQPRAQRSIISPRGAILILLLAGLLFSSVYPVRRYFAVKHSIAQLHQEERALRDRQVELRKQGDLLNTDSEIERLAREYGFVRPGEVPFAVAGPPAASSQRTQVASSGLLPPEKTSSSGFFSRIWDSILRAAHTIG